ncbi:MAG: hypothetical protein IT167_17750 [Bryobacterales bacterium]|nr:hypothetical protein [Bryobacterales bacterium]
MISRLVRLSCLVLVAFAATVPPSTISLMRVPQGGMQPQVVEEADGGIHMLYFLGDPKGGDLYYVQAKAAGEAFSKPMRVNSQPGSAIAIGTIRGGQIALGKGGRVHVAWNGSNSALPQGPLNPESGKPGNPMLYARLNDEGTAFEPQRNLMMRTFGLDGGGTVAADTDGNVYVAWHGKGMGAAKGEAGRQVWVAESHDGGKTFRLENPAWKAATGACGCCGMAMFGTREGRLLALYRSATEEVHRDIYLLASEDKGKSFHGSLVQRWEINACPMSSMSFAENRGTTVAAWETGGQVFYGEVSADKVAKPVAAPGEGKGRKHPRVARNAKGETLLVWTEGTGWQRGGSLAWQLFDPSGNPIGEKGSLSGVPVWSFGAVAPRADGSFTIYY